jgi:hypothetical protein
MMYCQNYIKMKQGVSLILGQGVFNGGVNLQDCNICEITMFESAFYHHAKLCLFHRIRLRKYNKQSCKFTPP